MLSRKRNRNETVTDLLPILVPFCKSGAVSRPDGHVLLQKERETNFQPVVRFTISKDQKLSKRFRAVSRLFFVGHEMPKSEFRLLVEPVYGATLSEAIRKQVLNQPRRWLPVFFNQEIQPARIVMWWLENKTYPDFAIYCPNETVAALVSLLRGRDVRACLGCGVPFTPARPNQLYHDYHCAVRHRMASYRKRKKSRGGRKSHGKK